MFRGCGSDIAHSTGNPTGLVGAHSLYQAAPGIYIPAADDVVYGGGSQLATRRFGQVPVGHDRSVKMQRTNIDDEIDRRADARDPGESKLGKLAGLERRKGRSPNRSPRRQL